MKLLMVTHYFDSHSGGIEIVARELFRRLACPECHITWAAANVSEPPGASQHGSSLPLNAWNGVEKAIGLPLPVPSPASLYKLWSAVGKSDAVILHDCLYLNNIAAFVFARVRRVPVVIVQHIGTVPYANPFVAALMTLADATISRMMLQAADQVVFISQITERHFDRLRFVRPPTLIFNGVDTQIFYPPQDASAKAALRATMSLPAEGAVALFVGRFVEKKGLPLLRKMVQADPALTWAFAGSGPLNPRDWGLPNVKVYSDLRGESLADLYRASDVFVLPSTGEGFPLVVQEALACGVPVVCSAETATADDAMTSLVRGVPIASSDDRQTVADFLSALRESIRVASQEQKTRQFEFVQGRYSWPRIGDRYKAILSELILGPDRTHQRRTAESSSSPGAEGVESERSRL